MTSKVPPVHSKVLFRQRENEWVQAEVLYIWPADPNGEIWLNLLAQGGKFYTIQFNEFDFWLQEEPSMKKKDKVMVKYGGFWTAGFIKEKVNGRYIVELKVGGNTVTLYEVKEGELVHAVKVKKKRTVVL